MKMSLVWLERGLIWVLSFTIGYIVVVSSCEQRSKSFSESLVLSCLDVNCTWFHVVGNTSVPVESRILDKDTGNINLPGNDVDSFGEFVMVTSTTNTSQCYEVCPPDSSICDNCSSIIINGMVNPLEVDLCIGDNINMTLQAPAIFDMYLGGSLKRGEVILSCNGKCCAVDGNILTNSIAYQCINMDITDSGLYYGHVLISCGGNNVEWCTPKVNVIIRSCSDPTSVTSGVTSTIMSGPTSPATMSSLLLSSSSSYSLLSSTVSLPVTTMLPSPTSNGTVNSNDDDDDASVGAIVGSVFGVIAVILIILLVITGYRCLTKKKPKKGISVQCTEDNGGVELQN